jgi:hypothetical protein
MSLGIVLDVAIGLAFTYLLLSIMVSGLQEICTNFISLRGKKLRSGIAALLAGIDKNGLPSTALFDKVFGHALISDLATKKLPSYVPARNFSMALFEALKKDGSQDPLFKQIEQGIASLPEGSAKQSLTAFVTQAAGDVATLQKRVETWFDDGMDRVSGTYRRFSQYFTLGCGLVIAILINVDSITLARTLWTDPTIRAVLVGAAQQYEDEAKTAPTADAKAKADEARCRLAFLPLPIGWRDTQAIVEACKAGKTPSDTIDMSTAASLFYDRVFSKNGSGLWVVFGWFVTALAVSFGAPFWFAALQDLFKIRNAGPKPPRADQGGGT